MHVVQCELAKPQAPTMGYFETLGGSRLTGSISIVYMVLSMRTLPRTMDLPGKSAATKHPKKLVMACWNLGFTSHVKYWWQQNDLL